MNGLGRHVVAIVAIVAVFSVPLAGILQPVLRDLVPLVYIGFVVGTVTLSARYLLDYHHRLKLVELDRGRDLALAEAERYREADRLIKANDPLEQKVRELAAKNADSGDGP